MVGTAGRPVKRPDRLLIEAPRSDEACLHQEHQGGPAEPTKERQLGRGAHPERADEDQVEHGPDARGDAGLGQPDKDLDDEVAHRRLRPPDGPGAPG